MKKKRAELLAPAGSFESMKAAVAAGADAVYIGGSRFGARAYADNLDEERMLEAIDYAHLYGVSLYMTVNTLMKEEELEELFEYLNPYYERGLDGVIVQDIGVFSYIRSRFPCLPVHCSTQMTVTGAYGAKMLKRLGASRVVMAREVSLEEIKGIHREVPIEIEAFVHGALCYCYSGQCLLSSLIGGRSGNRGRCAQPCRLPYDWEGAASLPKGKKDSYILSMKDLCTLDLLPDLLEAGIYSLKIEGRMKGPRYTAGVVKTYRKYVDLYFEKGRQGYRVDPWDRRLLLDLFDRGGFTEGYYKRHNGPDMMARKEKPAFRQGNQELFDQLDRLYVNAEKKIPVKGQLTVKEGKKTVLKLRLSGREDEAVLSVGAAAQKARNQPATEECLAKQMRKTGNTQFVFEDLEVNLEGQAFVPVKQLNELRRQGLECLREAVLKPYRRSNAIMPPSDGELALPPAGDHLSPACPAFHTFPAREEVTKKQEIPRLRVLLSGETGLFRVLDVPEVREVILEADETEPERWKQIVTLCHDRGKHCVLAMPVIFRKQAEVYFDRHSSCLMAAGFDGILVRSLEEVEYIHDRHKNISLCSDHNLYMFNHLSRKVLSRLGCDRMTLPLELNYRELKALGGEMSELVGYGFLPAMTTAQCVQKTLSGCTKTPGWGTIKDRTGKELPVRNHCRYCYNVIYNPTPLSLIDQREQILSLACEGVRLQFTREGEEEIETLTKAWADMLAGRETGENFTKDFTRGHFKRGVE